MWVVCIFIILILLFVLVVSIKNSGGNSSRNAPTVDRGTTVENVTSGTNEGASNDAEEYCPDWADPYFEGQRDKKFLAAQDRYYKLIEEIEADYAVLSNMEDMSDNVYIKVDNKCVEANVLFQLLVPLWEKYDRGIPYSAPSFKRLAMIREKRGDYAGAALACVQQLRLGVQGDGTKGGMRGRLARMVKKGNLAETHPEAMKEISQYLEVK